MSVFEFICMVVASEVLELSTEFLVQWEMSPAPSSPSVV